MAENLERIKVRATVGDIEEFKESIVWLDILRELEAWRTGFEIERSAIVDNAQSDNPSTASVLMHLGDINGRMKAVDYLKMIPDIFIQMLKEEKGVEDDNLEPEED